MSKHTVSRIFVGSVNAAAGGVVLLGVGLFLASVNGTFIMRGPDVLGIDPGPDGTRESARQTHPVGATA
jgi:hypothetical protein